MANAFSVVEDQVHSVFGGDRSLTALQLNRTSSDRGSGGKGAMDTDA